MFVGRRWGGQIVLGVEMLSLGLCKGWRKGVEKGGIGALTCGAYVRWLGEERSEGERC